MPGQEGSRKKERKNEIKLIQCVKDNHTEQREVKNPQCEINERRTRERDEVRTEKKIERWRNCEKGRWRSDSNGEMET